MPVWPWRKPRPGVDEYGRTPLWYCAARGDVESAAAELARGADATASDKDGYTALHVAAQGGHIGVVAALLEAGAKVNAQDRHGNGPLWVATQQAALMRATESNFAVLRALLRAGADPDQRNAVGKAPRDIVPSGGAQVAEIYAELCQRE